LKWHILIGIWLPSAVSFSNVANMSKVGCTCVHMHSWGGTEM